MNKLGTLHHQTAARKLMSFDTDVARTQHATPTRNIIPDLQVSSSTLPSVAQIPRRRSATRSEKDRKARALHGTDTLGRGTSPFAGVVGVQADAATIAALSAVVGRRGVECASLRLAHTGRRDVPAGHKK